MSATETAERQEFGFQAEVKEVLSLVVNSLYTHREVFLRELISNASDALDHLSFRALTEPDLMGDDKELGIRIAFDEEARTLTISDNGIGMSRETLVHNLGTIAHSGTRKLAESLSGDARKDVSLIGQFGVGFYSSFLVSERVEVVSREAGSDQAYRWESEAGGGFAVEPAEREGRGTDVILHIRPDKDEESYGDFLREWTLRELVRKYSDYVRHPIRLRVERKKDDEETTVEWEQVNHAAALWTRNKNEITDDQYQEFYKHLTHDWEKPLARSHFRTEGMQEMTGLLFVPRRPPMDLFSRDSRGVRLFVRRVFIMDECKELLPDYLRFVRGVIDSDDLPLNVSREFLQKDRTTAAIKKQVVRHVLKTLAEMADEGPIAVPTDTETASDSDDGEDTATETETEDRYEIFWRAFGNVVKEGVHLDPANRDKITKLLRFESTAGEGLVSLESYVERMPSEQPAIYYVLAPTLDHAKASPHIEALTKLGYEVLFMTDPVDEWVVQDLTEFQDKPLTAATKGALDLPESDEEKEAREEQAGQYEGLTTRMGSILEEHVSEVRTTTRLTDSPACLVVDEQGVSPHVMRMLQAQKGGLPTQKRILELNPEHAVVARLRELNETDQDSAQVSEWTQLLYDQALVAEGSPPSDPAGFARRVTSLLVQAAKE